MEPTNEVMENSSQFTVFCHLIANLSTEVEFLFRPINSNANILITKNESKYIKDYLWKASIRVDASREWAGTYYCQISNDVANQASINVKIICMHFFQNFTL